MNRDLIIKPEDIPDSMGKCLPTKNFIAAIVEDAIACGVVSPSVYVVRDTISGELNTTHSGKPRLFHSDHIVSGHEILEHWKGQQ